MNVSKRAIGRLKALSACVAWLEKLHFWTHLRNSSLRTRETTRHTPLRGKAKSNIAFHYTSEKNWKKIKKVGLVPYLIEHDEITELLHSPLKGIWLWPNQLSGKELLGQLISQLSKRNTETIIELKVEYDNNDRLKKNKRSIAVFHYGDIGKYEYHSNLKSVIITKNIPAERITITNKWNLIDCITNNGSK